jgi:uncharacterized iron-regulated protein
MKTTTLWIAVGGALLAGCTPGWMGSGPEPMPAPQMGVRPTNATNFRVVDAATGNTVPFASLVERASMADVVFFGEQHDDPETHFLEFALLEGIGQRRDRVVLSLEMFERDVQMDVDQYLSGAVSESTFLARSRPWPRYATDYRDMVQLARARGWPVVAANIPRPMASAISRRGMAALDTLTSVERARAAETMTCPTNDAYFQRFTEAMGGHSAGSGPPTAANVSASTVMFYQAQCSKDETMAESIARALQTTRGDGIVVHYNGSFHSDYGQGTAERVRRRMPNVRSLVITAVPVENPGAAAMTSERGKADYVIFTRKP